MLWELSVDRPVKKKNYRRLTVLLMLPISISANSGIPALAEGADGMSCPDLHDHEAVLKGGEQYFREHGTERRESNLLLNSPAENHWVQETYDRFHWYSKLFEKNLFKSLAATPATKQELATTSDAASVSLEKGNFQQAYELSKCIVDSGGATDADNKLRYCALNRMIRCKLILGAIASSQTPCPTGYQLWEVSISFPEFYELTKAQADVQNYIETAIARARSSTERNDNSDWNQAISALQTVLQMRAPDHSDSSENQTWLGLLLEWKGETEQAKAAFAAAEELFPSEVVRQRVLKFSLRHNDLELAQRVGSNLMGCNFSDAMLLVAVYVKTNRVEQAKTTFRQAVALFQQAPTVPSVEEITALNGVIPLLEPDDERLVRSLLDSFLKRDFLQDDESRNKEFVAILQRSKAKWPGLPMEVFENFIPWSFHHSSNALIQFSRYFAGVHDEQNALLALETIRMANTSQHEWIDLPQRFEALRKLDAELETPWVEKSARGKELTAKVSHDLQVVVLEKQKRECLDVAAKLEVAAAQLESHNLFEKAQEMRQESYEIKAKNLGQNNRETLTSLVATAQTAAFQNKFNQASELFEKALKIYQTNKSFQDRTYAQVLESYAQMLSNAHQTAKADKLYEQARLYYQSHANTSAKL